MATFTNGKQAPTESLIAIDLSVSALNGSASGLSMSARYYFNLTNGDSMIRDEEGIVASSLQAAAVSAMEAVEELRAQDPSNSDEWQGWRLEIVDASGQAVQTIPLDALSAH
jgi:hypothetical protein